MPPHKVGLVCRTHLILHVKGATRIEIIDRTLQFGDSFYELLAAVYISADMKYFVKYYHDGQLFKVNPHDESEVSVPIIGDFPDDIHNFELTGNGANSESLVDIFYIKSERPVAPVVIVM
jgi:hypothetical protein